VVPELTARDEDSDRLDAVMTPLEATDIAPEPTDRVFDFT